jgi:hypothetical protein
MAVTRRVTAISTLVPKLQLGNPGSEAPASRLWGVKLELHHCISKLELGNERTFAGDAASAVSSAEV